MKIIALATLLALGLTATAQAQSTMSSGSASGATAIAITGAGGAGGAGNGAPNGVGYLNTTQSGTVWMLGNTPSVVSQSYDACLKNFGIAGPGVGLNIPLEIAVCWNLRMMDAMAKYPPGSVQYEMGCLDSNWQKVDWDANVMKCTANITKLPKNDPRRVALYGVPVVQAGHGAIVPQNAVPPTGVVIPAPNTPNLSAVPAAMDTKRLPRCKGPNDQSQCYSG